MQLRKGNGCAIKATASQDESNVSIALVFYATKLLMKTIPSNNAFMNFYEQITFVEVFKEFIFQHQLNDLTASHLTLLFTVSSMMVHCVSFAAESLC